MPRRASLAGVLIAMICGTLSAQHGDPSAAVSASVGSLPCTPIGVEGPMPWRASPWEPGIAPPSFTVVVTDIRPDRARLYLDDRFIGRADDFDGHPDVLYLEPGRYVLEARLGGYRGERFELVAHEEGCRREIRHWLERIRGARAERAVEGPPAPFPLERVFAPVLGEPVEPKSGSESSGSSTDVPAGRRAGTVVEVDPSPDRATLFLRLVPSSAVVSIDGRRIATGDELARMRGGLAVDAGPCVLEVAAAGYRSERVVLDLDPGSRLEREIRLDPRDTLDNERD